MNPELKHFIVRHFLKGGKALDLGSGDGTDLRGLKEMGWECDGVDIITGTDLKKFIRLQMHHTTLFILIM